MRVGLVGHVSWDWGMEEMGGDWGGGEQTDSCTRRARPADSAIKT